jgi:four helix bundle protein
MAVAKRYQDLVCWQLADELEQLVFELPETGAASKDFKFRDQIRDSSSSATRNMAEGFGRYWHADFAKFLAIARSSLVQEGILLRRKHRQDAASRDDQERQRPD